MDFGQKPEMSRFWDIRNIMISNRFKIIEEFLAGYSKSMESLAI